MYEQTKRKIYRLEHSMQPNGFKRVIGMGGSADLEWIELGHATDAEIKQLVKV